MLAQMLQIQLEIPLNVVQVSGHDAHTPFEWKIESDPLSGEVIKFRLGHWGAHIDALKLANAFEDAVLRVTKPDENQAPETNQG